MVASTSPPITAHYSWRPGGQRLTFTRSARRVFVGSPTRAWGWLFERCADTGRACALVYERRSSTWQRWTADELHARGIDSSWDRICSLGVSFEDLRGMVAEAELSSAYGLHFETREASETDRQVLRKASVNYRLNLPLEVRWVPAGRPAEGVVLAAFRPGADRDLLELPPGLTQGPVSARVGLPMPIPSPFLDSLGASDDAVEGDGSAAGDWPALEPRASTRG
jgi:hypothetical protein